MDGGGGGRTGIASQHPIILDHSGSVTAQLCRVRNADHLHGRAIGMHIASRGSGLDIQVGLLGQALDVGGVSPRTHSHQIRDPQILPIGTEPQIGRVPGGRNQSFQMCVSRADDGDGVDSTTSYVERFPAGAYRQRVGSNSRHLPREGLDGNSLRHLIRLRVDHRNRIRIAVDDIEPRAGLIPLQGSRVQAHRDLACHFHGHKVHPRNGPGGSDAALVHDHQIGAWLPARGRRRVLGLRETAAPVAHVSDGASLVHGHPKGRDAGL